MHTDPAIASSNQSRAPSRGLTPELVGCPTRIRAGNPPPAGLTPPNPRHPHRAPTLTASAPDGDRQAAGGGRWHRTRGRAVSPTSRWRHGFGGRGRRVGGKRRWEGVVGRREAAVGQWEGVVGRREAAVGQWEGVVGRREAAVGRWEGAVGR
ncbi:hypothetical protein GCM10022235_04400 [Kribbella ginsengisoli]|uniref:Uncharacterized protein n=1 Tax=Kribbella ginsengisoli TaxID=363865 RepID=A0ABP6VW04_9ACTN